MDYFTKDIIKSSFLPIIRDQWLSAKDTLPAFLEVFTETEKVANETYVQNITTEFLFLVKKYPRFPLKRKHWKNQMDSLLSQVLLSESIINLHKYLSPEKTEAFAAEIKIFLREVRHYTPELSFADTGQALRNYIVYMMFKQLHHDTSSFSTACYGYSMLYPFTDNYIDNPNNTENDKIRYNKLIRAYLRKGQCDPCCSHENKTLAFLSKASSLSDCSNSDTAGALLLLMLDAQEESLRQQKPDKILSPEERLAVSLYKGGVSVLIDRFYVAKEMTKDDLLFYLGFGFFLQLADDLQDIGEDSRSGSHTLFTLSLQTEALEKLVNKLLHFVDTLCSSFQPENTAFLQLVRNNCYQLISLSINKSKEYFSSDYIKHLENSFPVSFACLDKNKTFSYLDSTEQKKYRKVIDTLLS